MKISDDSKPKPIHLNRIRQGEGFSLISTGEFYIKTNGVHGVLIDCVHIETGQMLALDPETYVKNIESEIHIW